MEVRIGSAPDSWGVWFAEDEKQTPWDRFLDEIQEAGYEWTVFHPHAETHVEYEEQIERFLSQTDPELVALGFDTGHHAYRGGEPIAFMRKHHERIPYLHLKSVDSEVVQKVESEEITFGPAVGMGIFCEPALGTVDFLAFRDVLQEIEFRGFAIVEQDMYPAPFEKPLPIAKRTREYLREIGIG